MLALPEIAITPNTIHHMDLFALCNAMPSQSVDMILCDLPYGTTACSWDTIIPIEPMWAQFKRIIKPRGAIVLTASQPFTSVLVSSNLSMFRHEWVWDKKLPTGLQTAKYKPMQRHETILVFSNSSVIYYPIKTRRKKNKVAAMTSQSKTSPIKYNDGVLRLYQDRYPQSIIQFSNANQKQKTHPTQKPVALFEYLIRTYTQPGELVFDPTCGSGTTAVAARNTDRQYICGDFTREYVELARARVQNSDPFQHSIDQKTGVKQLSLFA